MSGSAQRWVLRLSTEGADQVIRDLRAAATESAAAGRAYDTLIKAQPALATGAERAEQALRQNIDAMRGMRSELGLVSAALDGVTSSTGRFGAALASPTAAIAALSAGAVAGGVAIARLGDDYTITLNKLRAATGSLGAAQQVYGELVALSQQTGAAIAESAGAFVRFSVAARAIGATNGEVLALTRTIQQAGLISGASTQEAAAGVQQLGQALASGTLQGDELRSILENMPTMAEALARELGVSVGQLRSMGSEGQLTSERVFQALLRAGAQINQQFTELTPTMGQAFGMLGQAMADFVGKLDRALGLSQGIAAAARAAAGFVGGATAALTPRSASDQAAFDVEQAQGRRTRLETELASLTGEPGVYATPRRGTVSRALQETAAQSQPRDERLAELRHRIEADTRVIAEGRERQDIAARDADDVRQAEEATAAARRAATRQAETRAAGQALRERNKSEQDLQAAHNTRLAEIERNRLAGHFSQGEADRLRASETRKLAAEIENLRGASRGRVTTDQEIVRVSRIVEDVERDRLSLLREGVSITQSVRTEAERYAEQLGVLNALLSQGAITQETYNRAVAAADPAARAATAAAAEATRSAQSAANSIESNFTGAFTRAFEAGANAGQSFLTSIRNGVRSLATSIASQLVFRMAVVPLVNAGASALGYAGNFLAAPNTAIGGANLSSIFGLGSTAAGGAGAVSTAGSVAAGTQQAGQTLGLTSFGRLTGLGNAFTGGLSNTGYATIDGALNTTLWGGGAGNIAASVPGAAGDGGALLAHATQSPGVTVGGALGGAAGIAGGAYGIYSGIQRGGIGGYTSAAGGAVSAAMGVAQLAGMSLGPVGWAAAAILSIVGAMLPGEKASGKGQSAQVNVDNGAVSYAGLGGKRFSAENREQARSAAEGVAALARDVGQKLGGAQFGSHVGVGVTSSRGSGAGDLYLDVAGRKAQFANDEAGAKQLAEEAGRLILRQFREANRTTGDYAGILNASGDSLETLQANLTWYEQTYQTLSKTSEATSAYAQQLAALAKPYDDAINKARELSLAEGSLVAKRAEVMAQVEAARDAQLADIQDTLAGRSIQAGVTGGNVVALADAIRLRAEARAAAGELERLRQQLTDLGQSSGVVAAAVEQLTVIQQAEAAKRAGELAQARVAAPDGRSNAALQQGAGAALGVIASLGQYAAALTTTEAAAGTAIDRLTASQRQFDAVFGAAKAGNADSISGLQGAAEGFRMAAREIYGGGQGYADALRLVEERISAISSLGADALTQSFMVENARANTDRIVDALADLRRENAGLRRDLTLLMQRPAA